MVEAHLQKYFSFAFSIDCVVFGFDGNDLKVLLIERGEDPFNGYWALPGDLVAPDEDLEVSVNRVLKELTGLSNLYFEQVETFGEVDRHPLGRVLTTGYYTLVKISDYQLNPSSFASEARWFKVSDAVNLAFDHNKILDSCVSRLQKSVRTRPIGFELLPPSFTLTELQGLYEAILNIKLDIRNFRKKILQMHFLKETGNLQENVSHRPAKLYQFDEEQYNLLKSKGFNFEV
ncbi:MAG: NUDIX hydrolase [Flavobacteriales bacterium]|nr:NUDIX hydrolase [Flavobacteriales bacterium]